jgi:hypothetical protein
MKSTKHEYDLPEGHPHIRGGLVEPVRRKGKDYPRSRYPRPPRHFKRLPRSEPHIEPSPTGEGSSISTETEEAHS